MGKLAHSIFYAPMYVAIENGYFADEGLDITLVNGSGADNVMTSLISGDADIGFMGPEATVYVYNQGAQNYAVNFAQLTQRAGNFLVAREEEPDFTWQDLKGKTVLGGREGGMPEMIFEYVLTLNNIDPKNDLTIIQNVDFGLTAEAFASGTADYTVEFEPFATSLEMNGNGHVIASLGRDSAMSHILVSRPLRAIFRRIRISFRHLPMPSKKAWITWAATHLLKLRMSSSRNLKRLIPISSLPLSTVTLHRIRGRKTVFSQRKLSTCCRISLTRPEN